MLEGAILLIYCSLFLAIITVPQAIVEGIKSKKQKARIARAKAARRAKVKVAYNKAA